MTMILSTQQSALYSFEKERILDAWGIVVVEPGSQPIPAPARSWMQGLISEIVGGQSSAISAFRQCKTTNQQTGSKVEGDGGAHATYGSDLLL
jgi:hypothetical protein